VSLDKFASGGCCVELSEMQWQEMGCDVVTSHQVAI